MDGDNPFNALLNPDKQGTLTGFLGGIMGNPTQSQYQGGAVGTAAQAISEQISQGQTPQQAVVNFLKTPAGHDFFVAAGPDGFDQLGKAIATMTPPDPKAVGLRPGETGVISQGGKLLTNGAVSVPTTDVQNFNVFAGIAKLPADKIRELAEMQIDPTAKNTTAKERSIDELVKNYGLDAQTGEKLKAGLIQVIPAKDAFNNSTGDISLIDMSDPKNVKNVLIKPNSSGVSPDATPSVGPGKNPAPGPGVTPDTGAGTGVLPPVRGESQPDPTANKKYFGSKADMFLGAGIMPNVLGAASKLSEQGDPALVIPEGAKANDRSTLIAQTKNAISAMGAENGGFGINRATLRTFQDLVPSDNMTTSPHAEIQRGIRLLGLVQDEIKAEEGVIKNADVPSQEKVAAAKRIEGWRRVERTLPTMDEMTRMEDAIRKGTAGAVTPISAVKSIVESGSKLLSAGKRQASEFQNDVIGSNPYAAMSIPELQRVDPRKLSREQIIQYRNRLHDLKAQSGQ